MKNNDQQCVKPSLVNIAKHAVSTKVVCLPKHDSLIAN